MKKSIVKAFALVALALVALGFVSVSASGQASAHTATTSRVSVATTDPCQAYLLGSNWYSTTIRIPSCGVDRLTWGGGWTAWVATGAGLAFPYPANVVAWIVGGEAYYIQWLDSRCSPKRGVNVWIAKWTGSPNYAIPYQAC
jgi:hypothetical protein